jgi:MFS transporter, FSR family, fosmidomycin resistance protein
LDLAVVPPDDADVSARNHARRTLVLASLDHALHDGFTDMIYVLLPVWQTEFALDYLALASTRARAEEVIGFSFSKC